MARLALVALGAFIGVCVFFAVRKTDYTTVDDLIKPENDFLVPPLRLGLIATLAVLLVMFASTQLINVSVGTTVGLDQVLKPHERFVPFLVGVLCGLLEQTLPDTFMGKITSAAPTRPSSSSDRA